jgi:hypothetical protein
VGMLSQIDRLTYCYIASSRLGVSMELGLDFSGCFGDGMTVEANVMG